MRACGLVSVNISKCVADREILDRQSLQQRLLLYLYGMVPILV
ncbi:hypothetical protein ECDEC6D_5218 [Escherichia coli DEC6D]|nr:hypothetical protein ECDEC6D_5218 [Escherichia coli DEC6D]